MADINAHITGTVFEVHVEVGGTVSVDDEVIILESMKMELPVVAEEAGTVAEILVGPGDTVEAGQTLLRLT
ncbi:MAG: acetyl-CoA carboxylase biotin carboxyl carrier protein subunit [Solirubrobacteraceae bacterium]|nr:acetyl-CoA carboxylase biotin carboxyl carrier protein subunit [Solirubrobacteraceae bacterium]